MLATLLPLHEMMERAGPTTLKEVAFVQAYGRELAEAHEWCQKYRESRKEAELHQVREREGGEGEKERSRRARAPSPSRSLPL